MAQRTIGKRTRLRPLLLAGMGSAVLGMAVIPAVAATTHRAASPKLTLAMARADVAAARRPLTTFAGPKVSPGPVPTAKSVVSIFSVPAPLPERSASGVAAAAKAIGWKGQVVSGNGNPAGWLAAINTAVTGGASAIVVTAGVPALMAPGIAKAKAAGAPFVEIFNGTPTPPPGLVQQIAPQERTMGYRLAEWVVQSAPNGASILEYDS